MPALKAETRCKHLEKEVRRLAANLERFSPSVHRISIRRADWNLLNTEVAAARTHGFVVDAHGVHYRRFELKPTDITLDTSGG